MMTQFFLLHHTMICRMWYNWAKNWLESYELFMTLVVNFKYLTQFTHWSFITLTMNYKYSYCCVVWIEYFIIVLLMSKIEKSSDPNSGQKTDCIPYIRVGLNGHNPTNYLCFAVHTNACVCDFNCNMCRLSVLRSNYYLLRAIYDNK